MKPHPARRTAFTLVEILIVVAVVALASTVALPLIQGVPEAAKKEKLEQDVIIVNNAIDAYLAAGGDPAGLTGANVIGALKQRVSGGMAAEMLGPQGPFLDPTVVTNATDFAWSARLATGARPRFVVENNTQGVIFGQGPAVSVGGAAARPDEARTSWLWTYAEATPPPQAEAFMPVAVDAGTGPAGPPLVGVTLQAPVISPSGLTTTIGSFPLPVTIANPNPEGSSRVYYRANEGNFVLYGGSPFNVDPGTAVSAVAVSRDPSRYYNSPAATETYAVVPLQLAVRINAPATVTYAQAGGLMVGLDQLNAVTATITLEDTVNLVGGNIDNLLVDDPGDDKYVPAPYLRDANFVIRYTTDGSDPLDSPTSQAGPAFDGFYTPVSVSLALPAWGTNNTIAIRAIAVSTKADWFVTSPEAAPTTAVIGLTSLPVAIFPQNPIGLPARLQLANTGPVPVGHRTFFTMTGQPPLSMEQAGVPADGAVLYAGPFNNANTGDFTLMAQATGAAGFEQWFASSVSLVNYQRLTAVTPDIIGANIRGGDVNGSFRGSIFVAAPADLGIFNAGGRILGGNLFVPGLPGIEIPGSGNSSKTVVQRGAAYVERGDIPRSLIGGKEYTETGQLAQPQLDLRQVVDLSGALTPSNYTIKITKSAFIEGKIYRRSDPPPPPPAPVLPQGLTIYTNAVTGNPATNLPAGVYTNTINVSTAAAVLRLGVAGSLVPSQYVFGSGTWSRGRVEILGPVEIYFTSGFNNTGTVFGATNTVGLTTINVISGNVGISSDGAVYATMLALDSNVNVGNGGTFVGALTANILNVAPNGTVNVEQ